MTKTQNNIAVLPTEDGFFGEFGGQYLPEELKAEFTIGKRHSKNNPAYRHSTYLIEKTTLASERRRLHRQRGFIPPFINNDPNYKRLEWVRYADDILIGIIGSKNDCYIIKDKVNNYLYSLGLIMN